LGIESIDDARAANRNWESRVAIHAASNTYDLAGLVELPYFEGGPQRWVEAETYTDGPPVDAPESFEGNDGLGEIVQAVLDAGLTVTALREHRDCEWQALPQMVRGVDGRYGLPVDVHARGPGRPVVA
jgi:hypothetical protein